MGYFYRAFSNIEILACKNVLSAISKYIPIRNDPVILILYLINDVFNV